MLAPSGPSADIPGAHVHDLLRHERHPLDPIFAPRTVAVIGATEKVGSVGRTLLWNLITNPFGGTIYPVNPKRANVLGIKAYASITDIPDKIDLAVIVTPAPSVPAIIKECVAAGVTGAIVISAGFKEMGAKGLEYERQVIETARGKMRLIGPNCLGVMMPRSGLNATFGGSMARPGNVAFISQSGALCTAVLDWSLQHNVGFSAFISIGSMADVNWGDLIDYLGNDPHTTSIVIYMESIGDAKSFITAAREVALTKPILVIKAGRTEAAAKAAASHTGSLTGSDEVLAAAFRRCGVLRVERIGELFYMAEVLAKQPRPRGPRLTILTNAGGPGVLATDALITGGGELTEISVQTMGELNALLPEHWSHNNPIDVLGDADPDRYAKSLEIAARDPNSDALLVVLTPQDMTDPTQTAEKLRPYAQSLGKPVLASWMGGASVAAGEAILSSANIPNFPYPDMAARVFTYMWRYSRNLHGLYETPRLSADDKADGASSDVDIDRVEARKIIDTARAAGRTILTEFESKALLATYGIPIVPTHIACNVDDAVAAARIMGYPIVLKLYSETITHKTDVGGVRLNLLDEADVRGAYEAIQRSVTERVGAEHFMGVTVQPMIKLEGYELILGSSIDPQFGPVLLFGQGGQLVEVMQDRSLGLPPLTTTLARRMIDETKISKALKGVRGRKPIDQTALELLMVRFSQLVAEQRWIKELDINPLLASPERLIALDGRVVLHDLDTPEDQLPAPAIRPYPSQYAAPWTLRDGTGVSIRPIRPEDEPMIVRFHQGLSQRTVEARYFQPMDLQQRTAHERLIRICFNDYAREIALVAERGENGTHEILGIARLRKLTGTENEPEGLHADFILLVSDNAQHQGLGSELLKRLVAMARAEGVGMLQAYVRPGSKDMIAVCERVGFTCKPTGPGEKDLVLASIKP